MGATDGFYNRNTGFLALKYRKVSLTAILHYLVEGSPKVRVRPTRGCAHRVLSLSPCVLIGFSSPFIFRNRAYDVPMRFIR